MKITRIVITLILLFTAFVHFSSLLFVYEHASTYTKLFTFLMVGIFVYSAIVIPEKKILNIFIYLLGIVYSSYLVINTIQSMVQNDYYKIFDVIYPLIVSASFLMLMYMSLKKS